MNCYQIPGFLDAGVRTIEKGILGIFPAFLSGNPRKFVFSFLSIVEGEYMILDALLIEMDPFRCGFSKELRARGRSLAHIHHL